MSACQSDETISGYANPDTVWQLQDLNGLAFPATATITFPEEGKIAGRAPCNSYSAAQSAPYPWFETGAITTTKIACPALKAETQYLHALAAMTLIEVSGDTLILPNDDGTQMVFAAAAN